MLKNLFKTSQITEVYNKPNSECITFEMLSSLPVGEPIDMHPINKGAIVTTRIEVKDEGDGEKKSNLAFRVSTKKGHVWKYHYHDCNEEIVVYKGVISEQNSNKTKKRGEVLFIPAFQEHCVVAEEDSIFYVEFQNPHIQ